jgi:hypothetical protein
MSKMPGANQEPETGRRSSLLRKRKKVPEKGAGKGKRYRKKVPEKGAGKRAGEVAWIIL